MSRADRAAVRHPHRKTKYEPRPLPIKARVFIAHLGQIPMVREDGWYILATFGNPKSYYRWVYWDRKLERIVKDNLTTDDLIVMPPKHVKLVQIVREHIIIVDGGWSTRSQARVMLRDRQTRQCLKHEECLRYQNMGEDCKRTECTVTDA